MFKRVSLAAFAVCLLIFALLACRNNPLANTNPKSTPTPDESLQILTGLYHSELNVSSFVSCEMKEMPGKGKGYWVALNDELSKKYATPGGISFGDIASTYGPYDQFAIYVRFAGTLSTGASDGYGHLGQYAGEIVVEQIWQVSRRLVGSTYPPEEFWGCD